MTDDLVIRYVNGLTHQYTDIHGTGTPDTCRPLWR